MYVCECGLTLNKDKKLECFFFLIRKTKKLLLRIREICYIMDKSLLKKARCLFNPGNEIKNAKHVFC